MMAAGPVADHRALAASEGRRDFIVVPAGQLARRDTAAVMQLGDRVGGPYAWRPIERRPEIVVEQIPAGRNEELVKRAKEARIAAGKQKPVQPRLRQRRRCLDER